MTDLFYGSVSAEELTVDPRELAARLCLSAPCELSEYSEYIKELGACAAPVYAIALVELLREGDKTVVGGVAIQSQGLSSLLKGCDRALLVAMTLGGEVDRLVLRKTARSVSEGFIYNAVASALAEALAETVSKIAAEKYGDVTARFSPGYGDLPLSVSSQILGLVDAERRLGIRTVSGLMVPKKSITAIIGVKSSSL